MSKYIWLVLSLNAFSTSVAHSAEWSLTSKLDPAVKYDDNVFMSENEQGSTQYSISPTLNARRLTDSNEISLSGGYNVKRFTSISRLNRQDPFIRLNSSLQTERSTYGLGASYSQASSRNTAEDDTGDFTTESTLTTKTVSPSYRYQLTERDSLSVGVSYSERTYWTTNFGDTTSKSINSSWSHQLSERLSGGLSFYLANFQSDGQTVSSDDDNYNLSVTSTYNLSELWKLNGQVGFRKLNSHRNSSGITDTSSSTGSSFDFGANRKSELGSFSAGLSRSLSPSSSGDVNEQDRINFNWSKKITELLSTSITTSYLESTSASITGTNKRKYFNFSPAIKWQFERDFGLNLTYNYRQQKQSSVNSKVSSNAVMITLIYNWDGIRLSR